MHAQRLFLGFTLVKNKTDPPYILKPLLLNEPFCLPPEHTNENIVETVISFVNKLPKEKQNAGAGFSVILALNNAYPCK